MPCFLPLMSDVLVGCVVHMSKTATNSSGSSHHGLATVFAGHWRMGVRNSCACVGTVAKWARLWGWAWCDCVQVHPFVSCRPAVRTTGMQAWAWRGLSRYVERCSTCCCQSFSRCLYAASIVPIMLRSVVHIGLCPCTRLHQLHPLMGRPDCEARVGCSGPLHATWRSAAVVVAHACRRCFCCSVCLAGAGKVICTSFPLSLSLSLPILGCWASVSLPR